MAVSTATNAGYGIYAGSSVSVSYAASTKITVNLAPEKQISKEALQILSYVSNSTKLSPSEKQTITRLAAMIDEYGGSQHAKLMDDLAGIVTFMELSSERNDYPKKSLSESLEEYFKWREIFGSKHDDSISITIEFELFISETRSTSFTAIKSANEDGGSGRS